MRYFSKTKEAVANCSETMEAETISKNGISSKSRMSMKKFVLLKTFKIILTLILFSMVACSSPESDGKKVGKKYCECEKIEPKGEWVSAKTSDPYGIPPSPYFKNSKQYEDCLDKSHKTRDKVYEKYATNKQKASEFYHALDETINRCKREREREERERKTFHKNGREEKQTMPLVKTSNSWKLMSN